jgi:hypothetical protein
MVGVRTQDASGGHVGELACKYSSINICTNIEKKGDYQSDREERNCLSRTDQDPIKKTYCCHDNQASYTLVH